MVGLDKNLRMWEYGNMGIGEFGNLREIGGRSFDQNSVRVQIDLGECKSEYVSSRT